MLVLIGWDANPVGGGTGITLVSVSGGYTQLGSTLVIGSLNFALYSILASAPQTVTITFSGATYCSASVLDHSGCGSIAFLAASFGSYGTNGVVGNTPTSWAPLTGDLPYGIFLARDAATPTPQGGWSELADLNNSAGQFVQMEVQSGPAASTSPQNETAQVTWTTLGGADHTNIAVLLIASSQSPYALVSQNAYEVPGSDTANVRVSQNAFEVPGSDTANARVSQNAFEVPGSDTANVRVSQVAFEIAVPAVAPRRRLPDMQFV